MRLRVICQICVRFQNFDTAVSSEKPRWENMKITDIIKDLDPALDYEIWICPACQPGHHTEVIDPETSEKYLDYEINLEALIKMIKKQSKFTEDELRGEKRIT